jgi:cytochrome P450
VGLVVFVPALGQYLVTTYAACRAVEADQEVFSSDPAGHVSIRPLGGPSLLGKDDPEHAVERAPINRSMRPKTIREACAPLFERNARSGLEELVAAGPGTADLNRDFAEPLAARNLADMIGVKDALPGDLTRWSHAFIAGQANMADDPVVWERADAARGEVDELLDELVPY